MGSLSAIFKSIFKSKKTDIFARYEMLREAVSGTMSQFYKARDRETDRIVGLKILDRKKTDYLESRFKGLNKPSEGEIAVSIKHERVVETYGHGLTIKNEPFVVMEFLEGPGLNSLLIGRSHDLEGKRLLLLRQAAEAVAAVHKAGYIHRDICPRNYVVDPQTNSLKLIDFGLTVPATAPFMQPGNRTGSPNYMAPEVVRRRTTDQRLDIYAFGASAYELMTFELPWQRGHDGLAAMSHGTTETPPLEKYCPDIDPRLSRAILSCLAPDPSKRTSTMESFLRMIWSVKRENR